MIKNKRLEERRKNISNDIDLFVKQSFDIVDRIHEILTKQGKEQKDLAIALGKTESEISKWLTGTHNFTIKTIAKIESVLGESIIQTVKATQQKVSMDIYIYKAEYLMHISDNTSIMPLSFDTKIMNTTQLAGNPLN